jgi:hypothetical protein
VLEDVTDVGVRWNIFLFDLIKVYNLLQFFTLLVYLQKITCSFQAKQEKPGTVKTFKAPVPPPSVPVYKCKKPVVPKATVNTRLSVPKPNNKTKPYMVKFKRT